MKLQPINGYILVKPFESKEKTPGGIFFPDSAKEKLREGEIVALAEDATDEVVIGDHVIYKEFTGTEVEIEEEGHLLLVEDDLLAKYVAADKIPE